MKIAHVIDYFHTDVGYQEYYLALHQARLGHQIDVIASTHRHHTVAVATDDEAAGEARLAGVGATVHRLASRSLGHDREWLHGLEATLDRVRPDVVHCHGPFAPTTVRTVRWCRGHGVSILVDNHIQESGAPGASSVAGKIFYRGFSTLFGPSMRRSVAAWVADGPEKADFLSDRLAVARDRIELIPLGFDPAVFDFDADRRQASRLAHGWTDDELVVGVTGKLIPAKHVEAVAAACEAASRTRAVRLVLAGTIEPDYLDSVRRAAPALDAAGRLDLLPMQRTTALARLYEAVDVVGFARLPSISIFEAAGTGAVVALGDDPFAGWLTRLLPSLSTTPEARLAEAFALPTHAAARAARARQAADAVGWPTISRQFLDRYEDIR